MKQRANPEGDSCRRTPDQQGFYSGVEAVIAAKMPNKASPMQVMGILNPAKNPVKKAEIEWLGIKEWLQGKKSVTKEEVLEFSKFWIDSAS